MTEHERHQEPLPKERLDDENVLDIDPDEEVAPLSYSITSYGADFPVDGLVDRIERGDIIVPSFEPEVALESGIEGFQRAFVWTKSQSDRFIESLLLGLPVPGIFLVQEPNNVFLVLDGQQRLLSMHAFKKGILGDREFRLRFVDEPFYGLSYRELPDEDRRRFDNSIIHATIVRQDAPAGDHSSIYSIFERLNTGGTPLQPHEIRVALYRGPLIRLLSELNNNEDWRTLYGKRSKRLKDQELILRFFAFFFRSNEYERPVKSFLNDYVEQNVGLDRQSEGLLKELFETVTKTIREGIGERAFRPKNSLNAAVVDSVMVGIGRRLQEGALTDFDKLRSNYDDLVEDAAFQAATESSTASEESVRTRLGMAEEAFANVP